MRTILLLALGVWMGREVYTTLAKNQAREREVKMRKALEKFIKEKLPALPAAGVQKEIASILGEVPF